MNKAQTEKKRGMRGILSKITPYVMTLPIVIHFCVFAIYPLIDMLILSFQEWNGLAERKWVGLYNYDVIFNVKVDFKLALQNTLVYTASLVFFELLFALIFAVWLQKSTKLNAIIQRVMFFPHIVSMIAVSMIFSWLMDENGLFNAVMSFFGLPGLRWLNSSSTAMMSIVIVAVWKGLGYHTLLIVSGLKSIPAEIFEAAEMDNTPPLRKFFRITLPLLSPQLFFMLITMTMGSFKVFESIRTMTGGGPGKSTMVLVYFIYEYGLRNLKYGMAAAGGTVLFLILMLMTIFYFKVVEKSVHYQ